MKIILSLTTLITTIAILGGLVACDTLVDNTPVSESKIVQVSELPPDSLLVPTDDFELITEGLPDFLKESKNSGKTSFDPWIPKNFTGGKQLSLLWELDDYRKPIEGGYKYKESFFSHPAGWCFGNKITNPKNNKPVKGNKIPKEVLVDIENETYLTYGETNPLFSKGGTNFIHTLKDFDGRTIWELEIPSSYIMRNFFISDLMVVMIRRDGIYGFDVSSGQIKWKLEHKNPGIVDYFTKPILSDKYFWCDASNFMDDKRYLYRIEPIGDDVEVLKYAIDNPGRVNIVDENCYVIANKQKTLLEIGIDDGVLENTYQIDDYIPDSKLSFTSYEDHPFITETQERRCLFNPKNPNDQIEIGRYIAETKKSTYKWQGWDCYSGKDENTIYGLDTKTGEKTWWIPLDELGENPEVLIADWRGILIGHGNKVSAYGVEK